MLPRQAEPDLGRAYELERYTREPIAARRDPIHRIFINIHPRRGAVDGFYGSRGGWGTYMNRAGGRGLC